MAMNEGSISINQVTGARTGTGLAVETYDALVAFFNVAPAQVPANVPSAQNQMAGLAQVLAQTFIAHVRDNADILPGTFTTGGGGPVTGIGTIV